MYLRTNENLRQMTFLGGWPYFGTTSSATPRVLTYSTRDVIDKRISVPAQHALVRLSKNPATSADAVGMLEEIKAGRLAGIYCVNWEKSAQRALKFGKSWWTVIPQEEDGILMLDPDNLAGGQPLIAFRRELDPRDKYGCGKRKTDKTLTPFPARLDAALLKAWASYGLWRSNQIAPCTTASLPRVPITNLIPADYCQREIPEETRCERCVSCGPQQELSRVLYASDQSEKPDVCKTVSLPSQCNGNRFEQAICKFKYLINNPRLVCNGQYYWSQLAEETFKKYPGKGRHPPFPDGTTLISKLASDYLKYGAPRNPEQLKAWFIAKYGEIDQRDVDALKSVTGGMCFDTVHFVAKILAGHPAFQLNGPNCLGDLDSHTLGISPPGPEKDGCIRRYGADLEDKVRRLRKTLDHGFYVRAGILHPNNCIPATTITVRGQPYKIYEPGHSVLIIGHNGKDRFLYWNTVQPESEAGFGRTFGAIRYHRRPPSLQYERAQKYVVELEPLPRRPYSIKCEPVQITGTVL